MRKIKAPKSNMDLIGKLCDDTYDMLKKRSKISTIYYFYDNESGTGCGGSNTPDTEQLCFMIARIISNRADALKMDRRDLLYMIESKLDNDPVVEVPVTTTKKIFG